MSLLHKSVLLTVNNLVQHLFNQLDSSLPMILKRVVLRVMVELLHIFCTFDFGKLVL